MYVMNQTWNKVLLPYVKITFNKVVNKEFHFLFFNFSLIVYKNSATAEEVYFNLSLIIDIL